VQARDGHFYGSTSCGGRHDQGSVFRWSADGRLTTLTTFDGRNGSKPIAALAEGADGRLHGSTVSGGAANAGTLFSLTREGLLTTRFAFDGGAAGGSPHAALVAGPQGDFFGCAALGGRHGQGTLFHLAADGRFTTLASFAGDNGAHPLGSPVRGPDGLLYGTTFGGGSGHGTVYRVESAAASRQSEGRFTRVV
jgi:uncharacterized repeat protein (TIGR03803 family)